MDISILICTYNRAEQLRRTLSEIGKMTIPTDTRWEVLVVDNGSQDHTRSVIASFEDSLPMRYAAEKKAGKSYALNHGLSVCAAPLIMMTDDDVDVDPNWMLELKRAAEAHPEADFFGGKLVPRWQGKPPAWMERHSKDLLIGVTLDFSLGEMEALLKAGESFPGANSAFRRQTLTKMGAFREDLGPHGAVMGFHEEAEYMERLLKAGYQGLYVPGMVVYHRNPPERMTERYMLRWFAGCGGSDVLMGYISPTAATLFGAPRYLWRVLFSSTIRYLVRRWTSSDEQWILAAISMAKTWGAILEFRRMDRLGHHAQ